jgi:GNAT superfamily N-acetyltransferase
MAALTLRRLEERDLNGALRLSQAERWSHRLADWEFHYRLGRGWVACDPDDKLLGTASWWAYGDRVGTVGLVLVDPSHQGQGIGRQLMNAVMSEAGPRVLHLVATKAGLTLYQRCGFRERHGIGQHHGIASHIPAFAVSSDAVLRTVTPADLPELCDWDTITCGASRRQVISAVFDAGGGVLAHRNGRLAGFALMRQSGRGALIGPVVADGEPLAIALIAHQLKTSRGFTRVDVPTEAVQLAEWLQAAGLVCVDRVTAMIRGDVPEERSAARIFGLVSQALG